MIGQLGSNPNTVPTNIDRSPSCQCKTRVSKNPSTIKHRLLHGSANVDALRIQSHYSSKHQQNNEGIKQLDGILFNFKRAKNKSQEQKWTNWGAGNEPKKIRMRIEFPTGWSEFEIRTRSKEPRCTLSGFHSSHGPFDYQPKADHGPRLEMLYRTNFKDGYY